MLEQTLDDEQNSLPTPTPVQMGQAIISSWHENWPNRKALSTFSLHSKPKLISLQPTLIHHTPGARCSSVVRAFAHGAMGRRIDPSWGGPIELFLVPASAPRLV